MKKIKLTQGKYALVDDEDFELLNQFKWSCEHGYAARSIGLCKGKSTTIRMHQFILAPPPGMVTDHKDLDKLNNQRYNLRVCTRGQNNMNCKKRIDFVSSKYKGISVAISNNKYKYYKCQITVNGKANVKLFPFTPQGEIAAAQHYNNLAKQYHGEFAYLNII